MKKSNGCVNMNCPSFCRSVKIRLILGAPKFPVVLYSPRKPVVKTVFINMCESVSGIAGFRSPKRLSIVHTLIPSGISFSFFNVSFLLVLLREVMLPSASI